MGLRVDNTSLSIIRIVVMGFVLYFLCVTSDNFTTVVYLEETFVILSKGVLPPRFSIDCACAKNNRNINAKDARRFFRELVGLFRSSMAEC